MTISNKGKWIAAAIIVLVAVLVIIGIAYLPVWSTLMSLFTLILGGVGGWFLKKYYDRNKAEKPDGE